jgi:hypothetical protein
MRVSGGASAYGYKVLRRLFREASRGANVGVNGAIFSASIHIVSGAFYNNFVLNVAKIKKKFI